MNAKATEPSARRDDATSGATRIRTIDSQELLGNSRELRIRHQGESYTLRLTRLGKLILTK
jgi:hemin uptake protein HemP